MSPNKPPSPTIRPRPERRDDVRVITIGEITVSGRLRVGRNVSSGGTCRRGEVPMYCARLGTLAPLEIQSAETVCAGSVCLRSGLLVSVAVCHTGLGRRPHTVPVVPERLDGRRDLADVFRKTACERGGAGCRMPRAAAVRRTCRQAVRSPHLGGHRPLLLGFPRSVWPWWSRSASPSTTTAAATAFTNAYAYLPDGPSVTRGELVGCTGTSGPALSGAADMREILSDDCSGGVQEGGHNATSARCLRRFALAARSNERVARTKRQLPGSEAWII
jgi:hypothetical protein